MEAPNIIREHASLTYQPEKRALQAIARHLPLWATPDFLTGVGIVGALIIGASYLLSKNQPLFLLVAAGGWVIHWFGDSLDGTVARVRGIERPRYGHYLDHFVDSLVTLFIVLCFAFSGYGRPFIWILVLIGYYLISIHSYLLTAVIGRLKLSYGLLGPTEMRIIFIFFSVFLFFSNSEFEILGINFTIADILGIGFFILFLVLFIFNGIKTARELNALDKK
ncbi:MAG TPA: CDP-alcohol phosphatidyltransferase family protein [Patescibacteria group bacterium]|nr:CDP-alcohol phosphatidyltransferase family protein [Patescibacteria group bacterium]